MPDVKETIVDIVDHLPPRQAEELLSFARTLLERQGGLKQVYLNQSWAGALREFRGRYTTRELQERTLDWRGD